jgi:hypothetical protein
VWPEAPGDRSVTVTGVGQLGSLHAHLLTPGPTRRIETTALRMCQ